MVLTPCDFAIRVRACATRCGGSYTTGVGAYTARCVGDADTRFSPRTRYDRHKIGPCVVHDSGVGLNDAFIFFYPRTVLTRVLGCGHTSGSSQPTDESAMNMGIVAACVRQTADIVVLQLHAVLPHALKTNHICATSVKSRIRVLVTAIG